MAQPRPQRLRLFDILNMIAFCEGVVRRLTADEFYEDQLCQLAVERALEIISEASRHIREEDKASEPAVDWDRVAAFGNVARHAYELLSVEASYQVASAQLGELKAACQRLYARAKRPGDPWPDAS